jgi:hypothetical protein
MTELIGVSAPAVTFETLPELFWVGGGHGASRESQNYIHHVAGRHAISIPDDRRPFAGSTRHHHAAVAQYGGRGASRRGKVAADRLVTRSVWPRPLVDDLTSFGHRR